MFSMEPEEIARILQERTAIFQSMGEGVVAIDTQSRITVLNDGARNLLKLDGDVSGRSVAEVIPNTKLPRVLETGEPEHNQELLIKDTIVITNRVPVKVDGLIVGAVATFRDKTEVNALAEELTGIKAFVEAQRVQNHEYMNKLHPIPGYGHPVIMAAGTFVQGASLEFTADAPLREPYAAYFQGGLSLYYTKIGLKRAAKEIMLGGGENR